VDEPDIAPMRLSAIDIVSLDSLECRAVLVHLAGNPDPIVTEALIDAVRRVLTRTRPGQHLRGMILPGS
jgi:hypothetical protein